MVARCVLVGVGGRGKAQRLALLLRRSRNKRSRNPERKSSQSQIAARNISPFFRGARHLCHAGTQPPGSGPDYLSVQNSLPNPVPPAPPFAVGRLASLRGDAGSAVFVAEILSCENRQKKKKNNFIFPLFFYLLVRRSRHQFLHTPKPKTRTR